MFYCHRSTSTCLDVLLFSYILNSSMKGTKSIQPKTKATAMPAIKKAKKLAPGDEKKKKPQMVKGAKEAVKGFSKIAVGTGVEKKIKSQKIKATKEAVNGSSKIAVCSDSNNTKTVGTNRSVAPTVKKTKDVKRTKKSISSIPKSKNTKSTKSHQQELEGLKDLDPEFYEFLKKNDKQLLEFNLLDSEDSDDGDESRHEEATKKKTLDEKTAKNEGDAESENDMGNSDDESDDDDNDKFHKPSIGLEVASDESDFGSDADDEPSPDASQKITLNMLRQWQSQLEKPNVSVDLCRKVIQGFSSALASISGDDELGKVPTTYKVVGAAIFNGVVQLCVLHLQPAILRVLGVKPRSTIPLHKTKKWVKVRSCLRYYLIDLIRLIEQVSSSNLLSVLLKHLHQMAGMVASFSTLGKTILKRLIVIWATGDETVRVLAFLCILKITRNQQVSMLNHVLKAMYLSYVRNSKFVSPNTLPAINFMRRSLVEMFALDLNVSYQHVFLYIRQLAIHLRNAVILKKKDSFQAVYNWQFVNSLRLWTDVLGATTEKPQMQPLVYPLVTIAIGAVRLIPTAQYFPLRFHCIHALISLAKETNTFIPVLPLVLEVLRSNTFNRKHTAVSMRPLQFTCILRLNKTQLSENGFRDEVVEQVCGLTLEYLAHESASLAFSDLVVPVVTGLKAFLKKCRNANYSRKLKQLLDKIQENVKVIDEQRRKITFSLNELQQVRSWETQVRNKGTPLGVYYESWVKMHETKKRRQAAQTDSINADYNVPPIKRNAKSSSVPVRNENGELELFPSDSEDNELHNLAVDNDGDVEAEVSEESTKKPKNKKHKQAKAADKVELVDVPLEEPSTDNVDIVKDLDLNDW